MSAHVAYLETQARDASMLAENAIGTDDWPELDAAAEAAFARFESAYWGV